MSMNCRKKGELTDVSLQLQVLSEQYYQKDYAFRIRVDNQTQGSVEFQLRSRGPGLGIDILAGDDEVAAAYEAELEQFRAELAEIPGLLVRRVEVSPQGP